MSETETETTRCSCSEFARDPECAVHGVQARRDADRGTSRPSSPLPARVVVGKNGAYWRDFGDHYSLIEFARQQVANAREQQVARASEAEFWRGRAGAFVDVIAWAEGRADWATIQPDDPSGDSEIDWKDLQAGDTISLFVMDRQEGLTRETRGVLRVDWPMVTLSEGGRVYEIDATMKDKLVRGLRLVNRVGA